VGRGQVVLPERERGDEDEGGPHRRTVLAQFPRNSGAHAGAAAGSLVVRAPAVLFLFLSACESVSLVGSRGDLELDATAIDFGAVPVGEVAVREVSVR